jgi:cytochrome c556
MEGDRMKRITRITIFVLCAVFGFSVAYAQFAKPEDAIKYRKAAMFLILHHFKPIGAVVQGKAEYDKDAFSVNANAIKMLAALPLEVSLVRGSDKGGTTLSSVALAKPAEFKKTAESFETAAAMLAGAAQGGDPNAIKAKFGAVAQSCGSCHKQFRTK